MPRPMHTAKALQLGSKITCWQAGQATSQCLVLLCIPKQCQQGLVSSCSNLHSVYRFNLYQGYAASLMKG